MHYYTKWVRISGGSGKFALVAYANGSVNETSKFHVLGQIISTRENVMLSCSEEDTGS